MNIGGLPQDGAGHTFSVYATDAANGGHTSGTISAGYTDPPVPPPPTATVTVTTPTCPQTSSPSRELQQDQPADVSRPDGYSNGFIPHGTRLTVTCYQYGESG